MKTAAKPQDIAAAHIEFGVEIETMIPADSGIPVGGYHRGNPVVTGLDKVTRSLLTAPVLPNSAVISVPTWRADRDASIQCDPGYVPCEFVSPILRGEAGLTNLRQMLEFIRGIGGQVNRSCGLHITVGIRSITGTSEQRVVADFLRKLCHISQQNAWAIYAQTGTDRHLNSYAHRLAPEVETYLRSMVSGAASPLTVASYAEMCGRGMINLRKAFLGDRGAVEFRAFAGTLNEPKLLHHVATTLGLARRAMVTRTFGRFQKSPKKNRSKTAPEAVRRLWRILGWCDATECQQIALGLFGALHSEFGSYRKAALEMAEKFEQRFPAANL